MLIKQEVYFHVVMHIECCIFDKDYTICFSDRGMYTLLYLFSVEWALGLILVETLWNRLTLSSNFFFNILNKTKTGKVSKKTIEITEL